MDNQLPEAFMIMKAGAHEGECLDCIRKRKERELLSKAKKIFWGYGGNRLLPERVQCFARQWDKKQGSIEVLMPLTRKEEQARSKREKNPAVANHQCQPQYHLRADKYSVDKKKWEPVDEKINVPGSEYALVLDEIKPVHLELDRQQFKVGIGPSKGRNAAEYGGRDRFDQVCLVAAESTYDGPVAPETATIAYQACLIEPYAVFLQ